jgi:ABC-type glutathione transport system ATPase component
LRPSPIRLPAGGDRAHAVDGVSFDLVAGEILCLVGESGSGNPPAAGVAPAGLVLGQQVGAVEADLAAGRCHRLRHAVDGVSFDLVAGEILCLVGESGSGKSMCAHALMGTTVRRGGRASISAVSPGQARVEGVVEALADQVEGEQILAVVPRARRSQPDVVGLHGRGRAHGDPAGVVDPRRSATGCWAGSPGAGW